MALLTTKVLTQLAMPLGTGGLLILAGLVALWLRRRRLGTGLALGGFAWVWLWATPVFSDRIRGSLERHYPPLPIASIPSADAVVVLGGGIGGTVPPRLFPDLNDAADRVWHGARLVAAGKAPLVIASGGHLPWRPEQGPEADAMLAFLSDLGVAPKHVVREGRSETTRGNALQTRRLQHGLGLQRVLLVTSALHMRRAEATFRAAGIAVVPVAIDHEVVERPSVTLLDYLPDAAALEGSSRAFKEYLGLLVYRLRGWADSADSA